MKRHTTFSISLLLVLSLALAGCSTADKTDATSKISTQLVKQGDLQIGLYADGRIAIPLTKLNFDVSGTIRTIYVESGQTVMAGELLADLETDDMVTAISSAENALRKAQVAYDEAVSSRDYTLKSEKIKLDSLYAKYVAPFDDDDYQLAIDDAEFKVAEKEEILALAQAALDELLAEQTAESETTTKSEPSAETEPTETTGESYPSETSNQTETTPSQSNAQGTQPSANDSDAAIIEAQKAVEAAEAALASAQTSLTNALNSLANAKAKYDTEKAAAKEAYNLQKLKYDNLSHSTASIVYAELNLAEAQAKLDTANASLANAKLYAPVAGKIIDIAYAPGDIIQARASTISGTSSSTTSSTADFMTLYDPANVQLIANVNEGDISGLEIGQEMRVSVDALFLENQPGNVTSVSILPKIDNTGIVTYAVTGRLERPDERILDGMNTFVMFLKKEKTNVLLVSNKAIFMEDGKQFVNVQKTDGTLEKRPVVCGLTNGTLSEVIDGLAAGESVVTGGLVK